MDDVHLLMGTTRNQHTIARRAAVEGFGYWSGRDVCVEFRPAEPNTGIVFVRVDLAGRPRIPARIDSRVDTPLRTSLRRGNACVQMVEHIMAALGGLQIDNCEVWVDEAEMPGCDGSAGPFVEALDASGIVPQDAVQPQLHVREVVRIGDRQCWMEVRPTATSATQLKYDLDYGRTSIGRQTFGLTLSPDSFRAELARSRTFLLRSEAERLLAEGLGGRTSFRDLLVFDDDPNGGPIDNTLRFPDECVRHKLLDMVGDLALAGCDLIGSFVGWRSGHQLNARLVRALLAKAQPVRAYRQCA
jgi:UDP-3-O-acyl N-acetylglucosamine deacetylase